MLVATNNFDRYQWKFPNSSSTLGSACLIIGSWEEDVSDAEENNQAIWQTELMKCGKRLIKTK